jgi:flagellar basal-body rod protein FlgG
MYSRDGSFQMNQEGYLVTKDGDFVLGESGSPIQLPTDIDTLEVQQNGEIYADGVYVDTFALTDFEDYDYIEAYGENLYRAVDGATETECTATVNQGYTEASNMNVVSEMVEMISIAREYESGQKVINAVDEMLGKMVSISEL